MQFSSFDQYSRMITIGERIHMLFSVFALRWDTIDGWHSSKSIIINVDRETLFRGSYIFQKSFESAISFRNKKSWPLRRLLNTSMCELGIELGFWYWENFDWISPHETKRIYPLDMFALAAKAHVL